MTDRSTTRRFLAGALATVSTGAALIGLAGTASASPVPGLPYTTADLCTSGGGQVTGSGVQRCHGGGDAGDVVVSDEQANTLKQALPHPPVKTAGLPDNG